MDNVLLSDHYKENLKLQKLIDVEYEIYRKMAFTQREYREMINEAML